MDNRGRGRGRGRGRYQNLMANFVMPGQPVRPIGPQYEAHRTTEQFTVLMNRLLNGLVDVPQEIVGLIVQKLKSAIYKARAQLEMISNP
jgi:hypothetical protein